MKKLNLLILLFITIMASGCTDTTNTSVINNTTNDMIGKQTKQIIADYNVSCNLIDVSGLDISEIEKNGDVITYDVVLENTGNTDLKIISIVCDNQDVNLSVLGVTNNIMEPGKIYTSTFHHVITNDEVYDDYKIDVSVCAEYSDGRVYHDAALTVPAKLKFITRHLPSDYVDSNIDQTILIENPSAVEITNYQLLTFLEAENSNIASYMQGKQLTSVEQSIERTVKTYNDAELVGIRSKFAIIHYTDNTIAICNAFNTIDYGLIYIDYIYGEYAVRENVATGQFTTACDMYHAIEYTSSTSRVDYIEYL
jgi:uncharacterized repeat protein (TIGR01451 family)